MDYQAEAESLERRLEHTQRQAQRLISKLDKMRVGKFSQNVGADSTLELEVGVDNLRCFNPTLNGNNSSAKAAFQQMIQPALFRPESDIPEEEELKEGMGKRMITVEVMGMQSAALRSGKVTIAKPQDLENEGSAILEVFRWRQGGDALVHTTVIGKLLDTTTGALVVEVYPFVVRTSLTATQTDMSDWVTAVRNELAAGVHPAPCALYARRVSKGVDAAVPSLSGADVLSAAKALLGDTSATTTATTATLQWSLDIQVTVIEAIKVMKEVAAEEVGRIDQSAANVKKPNADAIVDNVPATLEDRSQGRIARFLKKKLINSER